MAAIEDVLECLRLGRSENLCEHLPAGEATILNGVEQVLRGEIRIRAWDTNMSVSDNQSFQYALTRNRHRIRIREVLDL